MYPLNDLVKQENPQYLKYLWKKTNFLITGKNLKINNDQIHWLWLHLLKDEYNSNLNEILNNKEKSALSFLLKNFGYIPRHLLTDSLIQLEKKVKWIFRHPSGGIFIPLELVKSLMKKKSLFDDHFLFTLLYKLKLKEQKDFASLLTGDSEAQHSISIENNLLDMGLVLYIWLANYHKISKREAQNFLMKGRILHSRFSFLREPENANNSYKQNSIFCKNPVPLWDHLNFIFPSLKHEIEKWKYTMQETKKGFYRTLSVIFDPHSELYKYFKYGCFFPVLTGKFHQKKSLDDLKIVTPIEILNLTENKEYIKRDQVV